MAPVNRKTRTSRDYMHSPCRSTTTIEGPEFEALADPLANMTATWCEQCEDHFPISEFAWVDTRERISAYYARYQERASGMQRFAASRSGMFAMAGMALLVGVILGVVIGASSSVGIGLLAASVIGIGGGVVAIIVHTLVIGPMILRQVLGTSDPRQLE